MTSSMDAGAGKWAGSFITYSDPDSGFDYQSGCFYDDDGDGVSVQFDGFSQSPPPRWRSSTPR